MSSAVGLDIGAANVRAVALRWRRGRWTLAGYGATSRHDEHGQAKPLGLCLAEVDSQVRLRGRVAVAASDCQTLVRYIGTVPMPDDRLQRLLRLELAQHAGEDGDLAADTFPLAIDGDELFHCCAVAQAPQIKALDQALRGADVRAGSLHVAAVALGNAVRTGASLEADAYGLLVDLGARNTRVVLHRGDTFVACRQLAFGGERFTEALAKEWNCPPTRAEQAKVSGEVIAGRHGVGPVSGIHRLGRDGEAESDVLDLGDDDPLDLAVDDHASRSLPTVGPREEDIIILPDSDPALPSAEVAPPGTETMVQAETTLGPELTRVAEALVSQLASSLQWFRSQLHLPPIDLARVEVVGGGAPLPGLVEHLARRMRVPVALGDPTSGLDGPTPKRPEAFAAAIGLALSAAPGAIDLDLRPESALRRTAWFRRIVWPPVAAALVLGAAGILGWMWWQDHAFYHAQQQALLDHQRAYDQLQQKLRAVEDRRNRLRVDLRGIASRIYAARDVLQSISALKQHAPDELWITLFETRGVSGADRGGHRDTTIDRGLIYIEGTVKPESDKSIRLGGLLVDWWRAVADHQVASGRKLFKGTPENREIGAYIAEQDLVESDDGRLLRFKVGFLLANTDLTREALIAAEEAASARPSGSGPRPERRR